MEEIGRRTAISGPTFYRWKKDFASIWVAEVGRIIDATRTGHRSPIMAAEIEVFEQRKAELQTRLATDPPSPMRRQPDLAEVYRQKIENLTAVLGGEAARNGTVEIHRGPLGEDRPNRRDGKLDIDLVGNLGRTLNLCTKKHPGAKDTGMQITRVAGACNHRELTLSVNV